jgi:hypothetical protein
MTTINYKAPASLRKEVFGETAPGKLAHLCCQEVASGTLTSCMAEFVAKPDCKKGLYSILTDETANLPKTTLFRYDIEALARAR